MTACVGSKLSAYLDDELPPAEHDRVRAHLCVCSHCAAELRVIREMSQMLGDFEPQGLSPGALDRMHQAVQQASAPNGWRFYAGSGLVAASLLIISATWLAALPPQRPVVLRTPPAPAEWEQIAVNLRVDPTAASADQPRYADSRVANWMVDSLGGSQP